MRPVDLTRLTFGLFTACVSSLAAAQAVAPSVGTMPQPDALPPLTTPSALPQVAGAPAPSLGARARDVVIGKSDGSDATLQELLKLQQQQYLQELRAKMKEGAGPVSSAAQGAPMPAGGVPGMMVPRAPLRPPVEVLAAMEERKFNPEPEARVLSIFVSAGRARADVVKMGVVTTVKEGDLIDQWTVTSIRPDAVMVETTVKGRRMDPAGLKTAKKSDKPVMVDAEKLVTAKLKLAQNEGIAPSMMPPMQGAQMPMASVPPLPQPLRVVDSSSIPAPRLPQN